MIGVMAGQYAVEGIAGGGYDESIVYDDGWRLEDDMTYTGKDIGGMVKESVARDLGAGTAKEEIRGLVRQVVADELQAFSKDPS